MTQNQPKISAEKVSGNCSEGESKITRKSSNFNFGFGFLKK